MEPATKAVNDGLAQLHELWTTIYGANEHEIINQRNKIVSFIQSSVAGCVAQEQNRLSTLKTELQSTLDKISSMEQQMGIHGLQPKLVGHIGLMEQKMAVITALAAASKAYESRQNAIRERHSRLITLWGELGRTPIEYSSGDLSIKREQQLDSAIADAIQEKARRMEQSSTMSSTILNLLTELEEEATCETSKAVVRSKDGGHALGCSEEEMQSLALLESTLKAKKQQAESEMKAVAEEIHTLWERLSVSEDVQVAWEARAHRGTLSHRQVFYQEELARMRQLKLENMASLIQDVRRQLKDVWDALYISEEERATFIPASCDTFTEESLAAHETELARLLERLEAERPLLEMVEKRETLRTEYQELEASRADPSRLFGNNRGDPGRLLREERFTKMYKRQYPLYTRRLKTQIAEYEEQHSKSFIVWGQSYLEIMEQQQIEDEEKKKAVAQAKVQKRRAQLKHEMKFGSQPVSTPKPKQQTRSKSTSKKNKRRPLAENTQTPSKRLLRKDPVRSARKHVVVQSPRTPRVKRAGVSKTRSAKRIRKAVQPYGSLPEPNVDDLNVFDSEMSIGTL